MIIHLWLYEWKRMIKHPGLLLFTLLFPIIVVGVIGLFIYSSAQEQLQSVPILVVDEDQTFETQTLVKQLQNDETIDSELNFILGDQPLTYYLNQPDHYAALIQIPNGFTKKLRSGINEKINVYLNENMPFASSLAYILFESGQDYITSAQAGVNTVHHYYIKQLNEADERSKWIQQMTIHFTFFALNRNQLFTEDVSINDRLLSWTTQIYLIAFSVLLFLTYWLMILLFQPKYQKTIQERLHLISITKSRIILGELFHHLTYLMIYSAILPWLLGKYIFKGIEFTWAIYIQWVSIALILCVLFAFLHLMLRHRILNHLIFVVLALLTLAFGGLLIPQMYLPDQFSWGKGIYQAFVSIWIDGEVPLLYWGLMFGILIFTFIILRLRKVGRST